MSHRNQLVYADGQALAGDYEDHALYLPRVEPPGEWGAKWVRLFKPVKFRALDLDELLNIGERERRKVRKKNRRRNSATSVSARASIILFKSGIDRCSSDPTPARAPELGAVLGE